MKIAKRDIAIIMIVVGLLAAFCSYKFYFSGVLDDVDAEKKKQAELQTEIDKVAAVAGTETAMKNEVKKWSDEIESMLEKYDVLYTYEDGILWMKQIEEEKDLTGTLIETYTIGETGLNVAVTGQGDFAGKNYYQGTTNYSFSYEVQDYATLKKFIDYIVSGNDGVKTLDSMSFTVDPETGVTTGNISMTVYVLSDGTKAYTAPEIEGVTTGDVKNIFGDPTGESK